MGLLVALKAFTKALSNKQAALDFLGKKSTQKSVTDKQQEQPPSHLDLLTLLQKSGRLIDFLKENIDTYNDAQVGAAVRQIHQQCGEVLEEVVTIRPVMEQEEGKKITVPQGYGSSEIKVVGNVVGNPPFEGVLRHKGWKAHKISLPKGQHSGKREVLSPAEVEVK